MNLQEFLEEEREIFIKEIGQTRAEIKSVLTKAHGKYTEEFLSDFCIYLRSRENETTQWIKNHDNRLINKVLSEVQREVWKANYSKYILEDISTIIESLKVK